MNFFNFWALRDPQTFEKMFEFLESQGWIPKPQFWYPPLRFGSRQRIHKPPFLMVFWVHMPLVLVLLLGGPLFPKAPVPKSRVSAPALYKSGVARGLLQGRPLQRPMGWGVGDELTKT